MTERDRWQGLVCARCNMPMNHEPPLVAWDQDHVEGADLALVPMPVTTIPRAVLAVAVHPECVGEQE